MKKKILNYIKANLATESIDELDIYENLLESGLVDSIGMIQLVLFIETEAQIKVAPEEMIINNFMTVDHILKFIASKQNSEEKQV
ncbi:hypothetical protein [Zobellia uliginosa]|uniref:hypothetical protein n=1 Tax=Zobellia uliginosa TaxID=143224 RepID=UPI001C0682C9|nr:hypothetical protein [Zobellia uliginosa]MBU2945681.1 hypothetical protein [Zobellia uliginosa]